MFTSIDYMIYGMMAKYTEDTDIKNKFLKLSIDALLNTPNLNKYPYRIIDIMITYLNMKNYNKVLQYYEMYKNILLFNFRNNSVIIKLLLIIIECYIYTHQIQNVSDLHDLIKNIKYNDYLKKEIKFIDEFKKKIIHMNIVLTQPKFNFNLIYNYDLLLDEKCLRDSDNKIMCLICLENIEQLKITLVQCNKCNKYIGHMLCIYNYICNKKGINIKCINCQQ